MKILHKIITLLLALATIAIPATVSAQYYGYNQYYSNSLNAYCYGTPAYAKIGETVLWRASVSGGGGSAYQYLWSGTDGLSGNDYLVNRVYSTPGVKTAILTVYSGGQTISVQCSQGVTVEPYYYGNNNYNNNYYQQGYQYPYQYQQPQQVYTPPVVYQQTVTAPPVIPAEPTIQYTEVQYQAPAPKAVSVTKTNDQDIANAGVVQNYSNQQTNQSASTLFSLSDVPWGLILLFIFLIMFGTVIYILSTKK